MSGSSPQTGNIKKWFVVLILSVVGVAAIVAAQRHDLIGDGAQKASATEETTTTVDSDEDTPDSTEPAQGDEDEGEPADEADDPSDSTPAATQTDPQVGNEGADTDEAPSVLPVDSMEDVKSWTQLRDFLATMDDGGKWYYDGMQAHNGITRDDVARAVELEKTGWDGRLILVSNLIVENQQARDMLSAEGINPVGPITRHSGIHNTKKLEELKMVPWVDPRSQVRASLALPVDWNDLSKGLESHRGVLLMCGNAWKKLPEASTPTAQPATPAPSGPSPTTPATPNTQPPSTTPHTTPQTTSPPPQTTSPPPPSTRPPSTTQPPPPTTVCTGVIKDGKCEHPPASE